jgi:hypothetical protein
MMGQTDDVRRERARLGGLAGGPRKLSIKNAV